ERLAGRPPAESTAHPEQPPDRALIVLPAQSWQRARRLRCRSEVSCPEDEAVLRQGCSRASSLKEPTLPPASSSSGRPCLLHRGPASTSFEPHGWRRGGGHPELRRALPPARRRGRPGNKTCSSHHDEHCPRSH